MDAKEEDGWTPLHWAAYNGHTDVVKALITAEADVDAKNKWGSTPLQLATNDAIKALLRKARAKT